MHQRSTQQKADRPARPEIAPHSGPAESRVVSVAEVRKIVAQRDALGIEKLNEVVLGTRKGNVVEAASGLARIGNEAAITALEEAWQVLPDARSSIRTEVANRLRLLNLWGVGAPICNPLELPGAFLGLTLLDVPAKRDQYRGKITRDLEALKSFAAITPYEASFVLAFRRSQNIHSTVRRAMNSGIMIQAEGENCYVFASKRWPVPRDVNMPLTLHIETESDRIRVRSGPLPASMGVSGWYEAIRNLHRLSKWLGQ